MVIHKLLEHAEKVAVVSGVFVALMTFRSQIRQVRVANSYLLLDAFARNISKADLALLESILLSTHESCGAEPGCFVVFNGVEREQHLISSLFNAEGRGLIVHGALEPARESLGEDRESLSQNSRLFLGPIRSLAEQLNIIAYETIHGQIEERVVHYKLGYQIQAVGHLLESALTDRTGRALNLDARFKWLIRLRRDLQKREYPSRFFATGC